MSKTKETIAFLGLYALIFALCLLMGFRMEVPFHYWQLASPGLLADRLRETILNLHSQPPLLNLALGLLLKVGASAGIPTEHLILTLNFVLGGIAVAAIAELSGALVENLKVRIAVVAVFLLNPMFYDYLFFYFYTFYEIVLLSVMAVYVHRYLSGRKFMHYMAVCILAAALVYMRSLFHFTWAFVIIGALPALGMPRGKRLPAYNAKVMACAIATAFVLFAWPMKNYVKFGFFGYSSWQGYNLASGLPVKHPAVEGVFYRSPSFALSDAQVELAMSYVPERYRGVPVLAEVVKPDNSPNWNHYSVIEFSKELGKDAATLMRERPGLLFSKALTFYLARYSLYEGNVDPGTGIVRPQAVPVEGVRRWWMGAYETAVFQYYGWGMRNMGVYGDIENATAVPLTGFALVFPVLMLGAFYMTYKSWKTDTVRAATAAFMLYTICWVLVMVLFVDGVEGNRIRFPTEPFTFILAGWLLSRLPLLWLAITHPNGIIKGLKNSS